MAKYNRKHFGCKIKGCKGEHMGLGYCNSHYMKLWRHGDPLATPHIGQSRTGAYLNCITCGKSGYVISSRLKIKHFCSRKCYAVYLIGKKASPESIAKRKGLIGPKSATYKCGKTITPAGYILMLAHGHPNAKPNNYMFEHRLVMEKKIGRYLKSEEHIYHINGQRDDNRISNLVIMSNAEHKKLHSRKLHN